MIENLFSFKIKNNKKNNKIWVMLGPYIKSRGTRGTEMSVNAALITMETYHCICTTRGNNLKTDFFRMYIRAKM